MLTKILSLFMGFLDLDEDWGDWIDLDVDPPQCSSDNELDYDS